MIMDIMLALGRLRALALLVTVCIFIYCASGAYKRMSSHARTLPQGGFLNAATQILSAKMATDEPGERKRSETPILDAWMQEHPELAQSELSQDTP